MTDSDRAAYFRATSMEELKVVTDALNVQAALSKAFPKDRAFIGLRDMFHIPSNIYNVVPYLYDNHRDLITALKGPYAYAVYKAWASQQEVK